MNASAQLIRGREARGALPAPLTIVAGRRHTAETILRAWRENKTENTIRSYQHDLEDFALYLSRALGLSPKLTPIEALDRLFKQSSQGAHEIVLGFRAFLQSAHLSGAAINRHMSTLRSVTKLGRMLGMMVWCIEVGRVKQEARRQTAGPTVAEIWCHGLRHTSITTAAELGQRAGLGLDKVMAHSRHANLSTLTVYIDNHNQQGTKRTLADLVAGTVTEKGGA